MSYSFTNTAGVSKLYSIGSTIDGADFTPTSGNSRAIYTYASGDGSSRRLIALAGNKFAPLGFRLFSVVGDSVTSGTTQIPPTTVTVDPAPVIPPTTSTGGFYITDSGSNVQVPIGAIVPSSWKPANSTVQTQVGTTWKLPSGGITYALPGSFIPNTWIPSPLPYDASKAVLVQSNTPVAPSTGGWYTDLSGNTVFLSAGTEIPAGWRTTYKPSDATEGTGIDPSFDPSNAQGNAPKPLPTPISEVVGKLLAYGGIALIGYVGYLYVSDPSSLTGIVNQLSRLKGLAVDTALIAAAIGFMAGASFFLYEFTKAYESTGSVEGAIGKLAADVIVSIIQTMVTAVEELGSDLFSWIGSSVKSIV